MRILKWVVPTLAALIVVFFAGAYLYLRSTLPDYDGEMTISGLKDKVEIIRDTYGMPHIYARTDEDDFFALGYFMAQDRLFQMDMLRRAARGKLILRGHLRGHHLRGHPLKGESREKTPLP